jgi:hypothetical protein
MGMGSLPYGKSLLPRPFAAIAGLLVVSAAAVGGWFAAGQLADQPVVEPTLPSMNVSSGAATVQLRAGWQLETKVPKVPGLATADVKVLAPQDGGKGRMLVTMLPGESAALPQATMDALRVPLGKPQRASLGGERATGYTALSLQGVNGLVDVYTLNTSAGTVAVTCIAPVDDPLPAGSCPADITALTVKVPRKAEPVDQLKAALPRLTTALNQARVSGRTALVAGGDTAAQQKAAASIATAYSAAATEAAKVAPKSGAGALLPDAFREAARSYGALATAASTGDADAWAHARKEVDAAERASIAQIAQLSS